MQKQMKKERLIQVYTGNGKGKTTAAVGQVVRALGRDWRVVMVYWLKEAGTSGEMEILKKLGVKTLFWGGRYAKKLAGNTPLENIDRIREEGRSFFRHIMEQMKKEEYDLLVLDEINVAINRGLVEEEELFSFLEHKPASLEVILTGRGASAKIMATANLATEMRKVKHPYDLGTKMIKVIED